MFLPIPEATVGDLEFIICELIAAAGFLAANDPRILALDTGGFHGAVPLPVFLMDKALVNDHTNRCASRGWRMID